MRIVITGSSGLVGGALMLRLREQGNQVIRLVRKPIDEADAILWNPAKGQLDPSSLEGVDAIVHLAGVNVAEGRWSTKRKQEILESRVSGLRTLNAALRKCARRPSVLISASATGIYGDRGDEVLDEGSKPGTGFLAEVCQQWEEGVKDAAEMGLRTVSLRIGIVLSLEGGALGKMIWPFKMGLGGRLGHGRQWMSWIALHDLMAIFEYVLANSRISGPVNAVTPEAVTNDVFTRTLGKVLGRPTVFPVPSFMLRLLCGEFADEALLASARVVPKELAESGFTFQHESLEGAFRFLIGSRR